MNKKIKIRFKVNEQDATSYAQQEKQKYAEVSHSTDRHSECLSSAVLQSSYTTDRLDAIKHNLQYMSMSSTSPFPYSIPITDRHFDGPYSSPLNERTTFTSFTHYVGNTTSAISNKMDQSEIQRNTVSAITEKMDRLEIHPTPVSDITMSLYETNILKPGKYVNFEDRSTIISPSRATAQSHSVEIKLQEYNQYISQTLTDPFLTTQNEYFTAILSSSSFGGPSPETTPYVIFSSIVTFTNSYSLFSSGDGFPMTQSATASMTPHTSYFSSTVSTKHPDVLPIDVFKLSRSDDLLLTSTPLYLGKESNTYGNQSNSEPKYSRASKETVHISQTSAVQTKEDGTQYKSNERSTFKNPNYKVLGKEKTDEYETDNDKLSDHSQELANVVLQKIRQIARVSKRYVKELRVIIRMSTNSQRIDESAIFIYVHIIVILSQRRILSGLSYTHKLVSNQCLEVIIFRDILNYPHINGVCGTLTVFFLFCKTKMGLFIVIERE